MVKSFEDRINAMGKVLNSENAAFKLMKFKRFFDDYSKLKNDLEQMEEGVSSYTRKMVTEEMNRMLYLVAMSELGQAIF